MSKVVIDPKQDASLTYDAVTGIFTFRDPAECLIQLYLVKSPLLEQYQAAGLPNLQLYWQFVQRRQYSESDPPPDIEYKLDREMAAWVMFEAGRVTYKSPVDMALALAHEPELKLYVVAKERAIGAMTPVELDELVNQIELRDQLAASNLK